MNNSLVPETAIQLKPSFIRKGIHFKQISRTPVLAFYELSTPNDGIFSFEVFKIEITPERIIKGFELPANEHYPNNEDFGRIAWSYGKLKGAKEKAIAKYNSLIVNYNV